MPNDRRDEVAKIIDRHEELSEDARVHLRRGGRLPKLAPQKVDPAVQKVGQLFHQVGLEFVHSTIDEDTTRYYCRNLRSLRETANMYSVLLQYCSCRCLREFMYRDDQFLAAFVVEVSSGEKGVDALTRGLIATADALWEPKKQLDLPTTSLDRNRPDAPFNPVSGDEKQAGVHRKVHPLATVHRPRR